ncbi:MAG: ABC transporter permease [Acidobacteriota bacterium]
MVLLLAFCIGVNSLLFVVLDAAFLRPLPYPSPDRLGQISVAIDGADKQVPQSALDGATWVFLRDHAESMDVASFSPWVRGVNLATGQAVRFAQQRRVSQGYFRVLGFRPIAGRTFDSEEDLPGGPDVVILSQELAKVLFDSVAEALGQEILLKGAPHTVVGIMPAGLEANEEVELWTPLAAEAGAEGGGANFEVIARLNPGFQSVAANLELSNLSDGALAHLAAKNPQDRALRWTQLRSSRSRHLRGPLVLLLPAAISVLLVGCLNIATLMLSWFHQRSPELALRSAVGATRRQTVRQLLTECLLLALLGGALGTALGWVGVHLIERQLVDVLDLPQALEAGTRFGIASLLVTLSTVLFFGLVPAFRASRVDLYRGLVGAGRTASPGRYSWARYALLGLQIAVGFVLLTTSILLLETLAFLSRFDHGFDFSQTLTAKVSLEEERYRSREAVTQLFSKTLDQLEQDPGIQAAAVGLRLPYERWLNLDFKWPGMDPGAGGPSLTDLTYATEDYFSVLGIKLRKGRLFSAQDHQDGAPSVVVSDSFVETYLDNEEPIGLVINISGGERSIIGVVEDVPRVPGWGEDSPLASLPAVYVPLAQMPNGFFRVVHTWFSPSWVIRSSQPQNQVGQLLEGIVRSVDPQLPISEVRTLGQLRAAAIARQQLQSDVLSASSLLILLVSALGLYGLSVRSVVDRHLELGIRMALGASSWRNLKTVLRPVGIAVSLGLLAGWCGAYLVGPTLEHLVWGVETRSLGTFLIITGCFLLVTVVAVLGSARRLALQNPAAVLRSG